MRRRGASGSRICISCFPELPDNPQRSGDLAIPQWASCLSPTRGRGTVCNDPRQKSGTSLNVSQHKPPWHVSQNPTETPTCRPWPGPTDKDMDMDLAFRQGWLWPLRLVAAASLAASRLRLRPPIGAGHGPIPPLLSVYGWLTCGSLLTIDHWLTANHRPLATGRSRLVCFVNHLIPHLRPMTSESGGDPWACLACQDPSLPRPP